MFKKLFDFGHKRTKLQALGFYIAYLALIAVIAALLASIMSLLSASTSSFELGARVGIVVGVSGVLILAFLVLSKKKLLNKFGYLLLGLLSGILTLFGGGLIGLIPVAYLTTKGKR